MCHGRPEFVHSPRELDTHDRGDAGWQGILALSLTATHVSERTRAFAMKTAHIKSILFNPNILTYA